MDKEDNKQDINLAEIKTDIVWIKKVLDEIQNNHLCHLKLDIEMIKAKLNSRPSWFISIVITLLVGIVSALTIFELTK